MPPTRRIASPLFVLLALLIPLTVHAMEARPEGPLFEAAANGRTATVKELLAQSFAVNERDKNGRTALMWAAKGGHSKSVLALLAAGAEVNAKANDGRTA
ncbi:MAG: ankyrin repeat domain-containing protein, partial [bacterium]|nr:ankyrin repeat domain-containing protein [bacterium]